MIQKTRGDDKRVDTMRGETKSREERRRDARR